MVENLLHFWVLLRFLLKSYYISGFTTLLVIYYISGSNKSSNTCQNNSHAPGAFIRNKTVVLLCCKEFQFNFARDIKLLRDIFSATCLKFDARHNMRAGLQLRSEPNVFHDNFFISQPIPMM